MKLFLATVALTTAIALPALAETAGDPSLDNQSSNSLNYPYYGDVQTQPYFYGSGYGARAQVIVPERTLIQRPRRGYVDDGYVDVEPAPAIRDGW
jgi:hypothetical protein